jgi:hypothetical protein
VQPSINDPTAPAEDQCEVKRLWSTVADALLFQFESPCDWEVLSKIDLSDSLNDRPSRPGTQLCVQVATPPHAPWKMVRHPVSAADGVDEQPCLFCTMTEATQQVITQVLALTHADGYFAPHTYKNYCAISKAGNWAPISELVNFSGCLLMISFKPLQALQTNHCLERKRRG